MKISVEVGLTYKYGENYLKCNIGVSELPVDTAVEIEEVAKDGKTVQLQKSQVKVADVTKLIAQYREELRKQVVKEILAQKDLFKQ